MTTFSSPDREDHGIMSDADIVAGHMAECTDAAAAIVVDGNADEVITDLVKAGWTLSERVDLICGKRIRFLKMPEKP